MIPLLTVKKFLPLYFHRDLSFVNKFKYTFIDFLTFTTLIVVVVVFFNFQFIYLFIYFWILSIILQWWVPRLWDFKFHVDIDVDRFKHSHNKVF